MASDQDDDRDLDTRELEVELTDDEYNNRSKALGEALGKLERVEATKAREAAVHAAAIKDLELEIKKLGAAVRERRELRVVTVRKVVERGLVKVIRTDNGQVVEDRPATIDEVQATLPHHPKKPKAGAAAAPAPGEDLITRAKREQAAGGAAPDPDDEGDVGDGGDELGKARTKRGPKGPKKK
jgi:hypothetical protein